MKKFWIIIGIFLFCGWIIVGPHRLWHCFAGAEAEAIETPNDVNDTDVYDANYIIDITSNYTYATGDISFVGESEILFEWKDGVFNVVYDANNCTEAAKTFFDCMLPYLNGYIKEKAGELNANR